VTARSGVAIGEGEMVEVEVEGVVDVVEGRPLRYTGKYRYTGIGLKYRYRDF